MSPEFAGSLVEVTEAAKARPHQQRGLSNTESVSLFLFPSSPFPSLLTSSNHRALVGLTLSSKITFSITSLTFSCTTDDHVRL